MSKQREIREAAMQLLFAHDLHGELRDEERAAFWQLHSADERTRKHSEKLAADILQILPELDEIIAGLAANFSLDRMNSVDRNVLRLAVYELKRKPDLPVGIIINEAIEIARRFATEDSSRFVNGVLDRAAKQLRSGLKAQTTNRES